ncbi:MAG: hypothetical protein ACRC1K_15100, partial [Planctomycetia bacterium]
AVQRATDAPPSRLLELSLDADDRLHGAQYDVQSGGRAAFVGERLVGDQLAWSVGTGGVEYRASIAALRRGRGGIDVFYPGGRRSKWDFSRVSSELSPSVRR